MSELKTAVGEYLALRRALGFKLVMFDSLLKDFALFAEMENTSFITVDIALRWAMKPQDCQPLTWTRRLSMIRGFAQYMSVIDPRTEIPPEKLLPHRIHRNSPYIFSDDEIARLVVGAGNLLCRRGLRAATLSTFFGLLAVTGMRSGEAIKLDIEDVNLSKRTIIVRQTKFNKTRLIPIHHSVCDALLRYAKIRNRICPTPNDRSFFISEKGDRLVFGNVLYAFTTLSKKIGLRKPDDTRPPHLQSLRHTFAVRTLIDWYKADLDIEKRMPDLSTYLGHASVVGTYWYLSAVPELLHLATSRLDSIEGGFMS
jgi:integrase